MVSAVQSCVRVKFSSWRRQKRYNLLQVTFWRTLQLTPIIISYKLSNAIKEEEKNKIHLRSLYGIISCFLPLVVILIRCNATLLCHKFLIHLD